MSAPIASPKALTDSKVIKRRISFSWEKHLGVIFIAPTVVILMAIVIGPLLYSFLMSLSDVRINQTISFEFTGFRNYLTLVRDEKFRMALSQSAIYSIFQVSGTILLGLGIAVLLNRRGSNPILRNVFLMPWALSFVVNGVIWGWIFNGSYGVLNYILLNLGIINNYHVWLAEPRYALAGVIWANIWKAVPFVALMTLAALQNVPKEHLDAAKVDGANAWSSFTKVTLPEIRPTLLVLLVIETMWSLKSFDLIWVLTQGGPVNRTMLLSIYTYQDSFRFFKFGTGSASAFVMTGIIFLLTIAYIRVLHRSDD